MKLSERRMENHLDIIAFLLPLGADEGKRSLIELWNYCAFESTPESEMSRTFSQMAGSERKEKMND